MKEPRDDDTTSIVVTTTSAESQAPPAGPAVAELQQVMTSLGYYDGPIDGVYGEETTAAVKEMQTALGVTADGIYGEETHSALKEKASYCTVQIHTALSTYGYHTGEIDGTYGSETVSAVKELQTDLGVTADGRVGADPHPSYAGAPRPGVRRDRAMHRVAFAPRYA
jgi:peptidoglycan hydrolase-like protein with peptidoglycan-binding domain